MGPHAFSVIPLLLMLFNAASSLALARHWDVLLILPLVPKPMRARAITMILLWALFVNGGMMC